MRFSLTAVPSLLLPLLVMWVAFAGWGILKALLALVTLFVIRLVFVNMRLGNTRYNPAEVSLKPTMESNDANLCHNPLIFTSTYPDFPFY